MGSGAFDMNGIVLTVRLLVQMYADHKAADARRVRHPMLVRAGHLRWCLWISFGVLLLYVVYAPEARAGVFHLFDPIANNAQTESNNWFLTIQGLVRPTFLLLATLEICWAAAVWAFEKDSLNSLSVEVIKKIMVHGFFFALLQYAPVWLPLIVGSFQRAGEVAVGAPAITTDGIINLGLDVIAAIWAKTIAFILPILAIDPEEILGTANPIAYAALALGEAQYVLTAITTVIIAFAYVVLAAQFFTLKLESCVLFAAGAIFLGFGSSTWTRDYVTKYLNYAINVGVRLLVMILILSLTLDAVSRMSSGFAFDYAALFGVMAAAVLQAILAIKAPEMAGALMNGSPGVTAGGVFNSILNTAAQLRMAGIGGGAAGAARGGGGAERSQGLGHAVNAGRGSANQHPDRSGAAPMVSGLGDRGGGQPAPPPYSRQPAASGGPSASSEPPPPYTP
jgi:type IV secretion system protein TrbL